MMEPTSDPLAPADECGWLGYRRPERSPLEVAVFAFTLGVVFAVLVLAIMRFVATAMSHA